MCSSAAPRLTKLLIRPKNRPVYFAKVRDITNLQSKTIILKLSASSSVPDIVLSCMRNDQSPRSAFVNCSQQDEFFKIRSASLLKNKNGQRNSPAVLFIKMQFS